MNFLRICKNLYSKYFLSEAILLFQLVCMIGFSFAVLNPIDAFIQKKNALNHVYKLDIADTIHFSKSNAVYEQEMHDDFSSSDEIYKKICETEGVDRVLRFRLANGMYETETIDPNTNKAKLASSNLLIYSEETLQNVNIQLSSGKIEKNVHDDIPILVDSSLADVMPIGTKKEFQIGMTDKRINCVVTGIIKEKSVLPVIMNYGSIPDLGVLGAFPEDVKGYSFIIVYGNDDLLSDIGWESNFLICTKKGERGEIVSKRLEEAVGNYGTININRRMIFLSFREMLKENSWSILTFAMLSLIAVFGFGGYLFLMIKQKQVEFAVFYILGMTRRKMTVTIFLSNLIMLVVAFVVASFTTPQFIGDVLLIKQSTPGFFSYAFCGGVLMIILLFSVLAAFRLSGRLEEIAIYKGGD
ncbi:MAG: hypothetical protein NC240_09720 [Clostridium sp.]|nr:hypothetical protein [Clostridium sp.]